MLRYKDSTVDLSCVSPPSTSMAFSSEMVGRIIIVLCVIWGIAGGDKIEKISHPSRSARGIRFNPAYPTVTVTSNCPNSQVVFPPPTCPPTCPPPTCPPPTCPPSTCPPPTCPPQCPTPPSPPTYPSAPAPSLVFLDPPIPDPRSSSPIFYAANTPTPTVTFQPVSPNDPRNPSSPFFLIDPINLFGSASSYTAPDPNLGTVYDPSLRTVYGPSYTPTTAFGTANGITSSVSQSARAKSWWPKPPTWKPKPLPPAPTPVCCEPPAPIDPCAAPTNPGTAGVAYNSGNGAGGNTLISRINYLTGPSCTDPCDNQNACMVSNSGNGIGGNRLQSCLNLISGGNMLCCSGNGKGGNVVKSNINVIGGQGSSLVKDSQGTLIRSFLNLFTPKCTLLDLNCGCNGADPPDANDFCTDLPVSTPPICQPQPPAAPCCSANLPVPCITTCSNGNNSPPCVLLNSPPSDQFTCFGPIKKK